MRLRNLHLTRNYIIKIIFTLLFLGGVFSVLVFLLHNIQYPRFVKNGALYTRNIYGSITAAEALPKPTLAPTPVSRSYVDPTKEGPLVEVKINNTSLLTYYIPYNMPYLEYWKGYIFTTQVDDSNPYIKLVKYDINTGEKSVVLNLEDNHLESKFDYKYLSISGIKVINDKMLIILSDYLAPSLAFWISSPTDTPRTLSDKQVGYSGIEEINGTYFLTGGFGDGCGGVGAYTLLNPVTFSTKFIVSSNYGCQNGEEVIGTYKNYFIIALHEPDNKKENTDQHYYRYLKLITFSDGSKNVMILSKTQIPPHITAISLNKDGHTVNMKGDNLYEYNLDNKKLTVKAQIPAIFANDQIVYNDSQFLCIVHYTGNGNNHVFYKIAAADGSYLEDQSCKQYEGQNIFANNPTPQETIDSIITKLNLQFADYPSKLGLIIDGVKYH